MMKQKKILGIIGAVLAIGGGVTWFFQQYPISVLLWGAAGLIQKEDSVFLKSMIGKNLPISPYHTLFVG